MKQATKDLAQNSLTKASKKLCKFFHKKFKLKGNNLQCQTLYSLYAILIAHRKDYKFDPKLTNLLFATSVMLTREGFNVAAIGRKYYDLLTTKEENSLWKNIRNEIAQMPIVRNGELITV